MERRVRKEEKQFNFIIHEANWMILEQQQMIIHSLSKFHFVVCLHWLQLTDTLIYNPLPVRLRNSLELVPQLKPMNSILSTNDWATFQNFASRHPIKPCIWLSRKTKNMLFHILLEWWFFSELQKIWMNIFRGIERKAWRKTLCLTDSWAVLILIQIRSLSKFLRSFNKLKQNKNCY